MGGKATIKIRNYNMLWQNFHKYFHFTFSKIQILAKFSTVDENFTCSNPISMHSDNFNKIYLAKFKNFTGRPRA